jgi:hypothetical protein
MEVKMDPKTGKIILQVFFILCGLITMIAPWISGNPHQSLRHDEGQVGLGFFCVLLGGGFLYLATTI